MRAGPTNPSWARVLNVLLSIWLFISAWVWPHSAAERANTWILGVLGFIFSIVALLIAPPVRFLNTLLAIWLFISAWALPRYTVGTIWNNVIVAILIFIFSLVPSAPPSRALPRAPA